MRVLNESPELTMKYLYVSLTSNEAAALRWARNHSQVPLPILHVLSRPVGRADGRQTIYRLGARGSREAEQALVWLRLHVAHSGDSDTTPRPLTQQVMQQTAYPAPAARPRH